MVNIFRRVKRGEKRESVVVPVSIGRRQSPNVLPAPTTPKLVLTGGVVAN